MSSSIMPNLCEVHGCGTPSAGVKLFGFPLHDENRMQKWISFVDRGFGFIPTKNSKICSLHFESIEGDSKGRLLSDPIKLKQVVVQPKSSDSTTLCGLKVKFDANTCTKLFGGGGLVVGQKRKSEMGRVDQSSKKFVHTQKDKPDFISAFTQTVTANNSIEDIKMKNRQLLANLRSKNKTIKRLQQSQDKNAKIIAILRKNPILNSIIQKEMNRKRNYDSTLKQFGMTLKFYSSKAHSFVRSNFLNYIPSKRQISKWMKNVEIDPGFFHVCFSYLKDLVDKCTNDIVANIQVDEISIRKQVTSKSGVSYEGFVDFGGVQQPKDPSKLARHALVVLVVGMNSHFKLPIAYFLTDGLEANFLADVITCSLKLLHETGLKCVAVVSDGLSSNLKAAQILGISLNDLNSLKTWFLHPNGTDRVYFILDICHMFKLLRNLWKYFQILYIDGKEIKWRYLEELVKFQTNEGLKAANPLSRRHVNFEQQKMKVKLVTQVFSSSVAKALQLCEKLKEKEFLGSKPTSDFIELMDRCFDALNSKNALGKGFKSPLRKSNKEQWGKLFSDFEEVLLRIEVRPKEMKRPKTPKKIKMAHKTPSLLSEPKKIKRKKEPITKKLPERIPLFRSKRKTAVTGILASLQSIRELFNVLVENETPLLNYILTYKLSQDHIETFFAVQRSVFGFNDNPNAFQLRHGIRKILAARMMCVTAGNCAPQDDTMIPVLGDVKSSIPSQSKNNEQSPNLNPTVQFPSQRSLSQFANCVVTYISGWVVKTLQSKIKCKVCLDSISYITDTHKNELDRALINLKQCGGLIIPSLDVCKLCKEVERQFRSYDVDANFRVGSIQLRCMEYVVENNLFADLAPHLLELEIFDNHIADLTKSIVKEYCSLRMHHSARELTLKKNPTTVRSKNTKLTHFASN